MKEVFKVNGEWKEAKDRDKGRFEFEGEFAPESVRKLFKNKRIPDKYRKKGQASPVLYSTDEE